jgi:hypothetical protein
MLSLHRLSLSGLGACLVVVGCASPVDDVALDADPDTDPDTRAPAGTPQAEPGGEGRVESRSDAIVIGPWNGVGYAGGYYRPWGFGLGLGGWGPGGMYGIPFGGYGSSVPGYGWGGMYPYPTGMGGFGYSTPNVCSLWGCFHETEEQAHHRPHGPEARGDHWW